MTQDKIFNELNGLIGAKMLEAHDGMHTIREFLDYHSIPLSAKVSNADDAEYIGDVLIRTLKALSEFLTEYRDIKDTWVVTDPSLVLDDEK